jgi:succinate dehydrogenase/fumarate reductase flavoprotein subunit
MKGDLTVSVTVDETSILSVEVVDCVDTEGIRDAAIAQVPGEIVAQQSVQVDNATGATMTSLGIKNAVTKALEAAGADVATFKVKQEAAEKTQTETENYDIVIVGGGMSGMSAAIEIARNSDASVLVLEKNAYIGGSSLVCGGGIWAINAQVNQEIGQDSTLEEYISFMQQRSGTEDLNTGLMTNIYNKVDDVITYYLDEGLPVSLETWTLGHPDSQLPVLWSVNNSNYDWETGESGVFQAVAKMADKLGVEVRVNSEVTQLVHEGNTVTGVSVEDDTHTYQINAQKVILATGGFTRNSEMVAEYAPEYTDAFAFTGAGSTGDGITLTEDFDINLVGEGMMGLYGVNMNYGYYGSVGNLVWLPQMYVNAEGETFGMESAFYSDTLKLLLEQTGSCGYAIFDSTTTVTERLEEAVEKGCATRYDSLADMAAGEGIDAAALEATAQANGLQNGPYYCVVVRPLFIGSIPGLEVDDTCHVLTSNGDRIENLYACGELIFGNVFQSAYPASGTGVGTSAYTGAIAGEAAYTDLNG